jgi:hypothetical protein
MNSLADRQAYAQSYFDNLDWTGSGSGGGTPTPSKGHVQTVAAQTQYQYEKEGSLNNMTYIQVKSGDSLSSHCERHMG